LLNNGKVLISGTCQDWFYIDADAEGDRPELYDSVAGTFSAAGERAKYPRWCSGPVVLLANGKVLIAPTAELYDPAIDAFSPTGRRMTIGFYGSTATLLRNAKVLVGGGTGDFGTSANAELYDPSTENFTATTNMTRARAWSTATLLLDGTVLIAGGSYPSVSSAELYDPATSTFTTTADMTSPRVGHTATLLLDGRILITGGSTGQTALASAELYSPSVLVPAQVVTDLRFDRTSVEAGSTYSVNISGSNLTPQAFFDVRFSAPRSNASDVVLNWQRGLEVSHDVSVGTVPGSYTIISVRAHEVESDHTGIFFPVSATLTVSRQPSDTTMNPGDFLLPGQSRQSADGRFRLVYQVDGNLVLYQGSNPLWASATYGTTPGFVAMQADGNFVVYDSTGAVWASNTWGHPRAFLVVQDDGNTVIYSTGSSPLWAANTCCR